MQQYQMQKFLPLLNKLKHIERDKISPYSTFYKEPPAAKLKILNQTLSLAVNTRLGGAKKQTMKGGFRLYQLPL